MRNTWLTVAVLGLAFVAASAAPASAQKKKRTALPAPAVTEPLVVEEVQGFGRDRDTAILVAEKKARERVRDLLAAKYGKDWEPPKRLLEPELLKQLGVLALQGEPTEHPELKDEPARIVATYNVALTSEYLSEVRKAGQDELKTLREERTQQRHLLFARILIGALVLLLVAAGYLRLEEWTRGYATRLLRIGALAIVLLAGAMLYLTR